MLAFRNAALTLIVAFGVLPGLAQAQPTTLYGITQEARLFTIDLTTGACIHLGTIAPFFGPKGNRIPAGIAFSGSKLYTWDLQSCELLELDPASAAVKSTAISAPGFTANGEGDLALRSDGTGFLTMQGLGWGLYPLDIPKKSVGARLGTAPLSLDGLAFSKAGELWGWSQGGQQLCKIDTTTGQNATPIPTPGIKQGQLGGLAFHPTTDVLYAAIGHSTWPTSLLYTLDTVTGKTTYIADIQIQNLSGLAFGPPPVIKPGVTITAAPDGIEVIEGGVTDTCTVALAGAPSADVTITLTPDAQLKVAPATLTFTVTNWDQPQTVTVTAVDDSAVEGDHTGAIQYTVKSADTVYDGLKVADSVVSITDNDFAPGTVRPILYGMTGWTSSEFLTIDPLTGKGTQIGTSFAAFGMDFYKGQLYAYDEKAAKLKELNPADGSTVQTIAPSAPVGGGEGDLVIRSDGVGFIIGSNGSVTQFDVTGKVTVVGNLTPLRFDGAAIQPGTGVLYLLTERCDNLYTADMKTWKTTLVGKTGLALPPGTAALTFDATGKLYAGVTANLGQASTLYKLNPATGTAKLIGPIGFNAIAGLRFAQAGPGVLLTKAAGSAIEGGAVTTYTAVLTTAPTADVTITLKPDSQVTAAPTTLTFTPANWSAAQAVTVTAVDDSAVEGAHTGTIKHTAVSADTNYGGITISDATVNITDNDGGGTAGVTIVEAGGNTAVAEGGATDSYTVVLDTAPTANVTITLTPDAQVTVAPTTLTFTPANWQTAQAVTVSAVDDTAVEGSHTGVIKHTAKSADTAYDSITIADVTASITDNDSGGGGTAGVTITEAGGGTSVTEGGGATTYTVVLDAAPTGTVTITLNPGTQLTVAPATLTFSTGNWQTPQTVTVTAVDDSAVEGTHSGTITHSAASADVAYNGITIASVTVTITDNDAVVPPPPPPPPPSNNDGGEGTYHNSHGPGGSEGSTHSEGSFLLAGFSPPRLLGPYTLDAQGDLVAPPLAQLAKASGGNVLVRKAVPPRPTATAAEPASAASAALLLASVALLLGGAAGAVCVCMRRA